MEGRSSATSDKRESVLEQVVVDPTKLRESLRRVDAMLVRVEADVRRRLRLLLGEVIGRSSVAGDRTSASIRIEIDILPAHVRVQMSGTGLLMPSSAGNSGRATRPTYPHWILNGLADRWGYDRRGRDFGMWFLLERRGW